MLMLILIPTHSNRSDHAKKSQWAHELKRKHTGNAKKTQWGNKGNVCSRGTHANAKGISK